MKKKRYSSLLLFRIVIFLKKKLWMGRIQGEKGGREKSIKKKKFSKYTETLIMTSLVPYEKSQQNKSNDIKESHQWWFECIILVVQICKEFHLKYYLEWCSSKNYSFTPKETSMIIEDISHFQTEFLT